MIPNSLQRSASSFLQIERKVAGLSINIGSHCAHSVGTHHSHLLYCSFRTLYTSIKSSGSTVVNLTLKQFNLTDIEATRTLKSCRSLTPRCNALSNLIQQKALQRQVRHRLWQHSHGLLEVIEAQELAVPANPKFAVGSCKSFQIDAFFAEVVDRWDNDKFFQKHMMEQKAV